MNGVMEAEWTTNWHVIVEEFVPAYHAALTARVSAVPAAVPALVAGSKAEGIQMTERSSRPQSKVAPVETVRRPPARPASGERIWITGVSVGLPGSSSRVFADGALDRLLDGACFIDPVPDALHDRMLAKRITRLVKTEDGEPHLSEVTTREDVVKLAARRGGFSLREDFDLEDQWLAEGDIASQLAMAAGLECLRDARIPLQREPWRGRPAGT